MSGMASNYNMTWLFLGQGLAAGAVVAAIAATAISVKTPASAFIPLAGISVLYGIMMFASSYIEEEQHFWYWATTAWFTFLGLKLFQRFVLPFHPSPANRPWSFLF